MADPFLKPLGVDPQDPFLISNRKKALAPPVPKDEPNEFVQGLKSGFQKNQALLYNVPAIAAGLGKKLVPDSETLSAIEKWGQEGAARNMAEAAPYAAKVGRVEDIRSVGDFGKWAAHGLGEFTTDIGFSLLGGGIGGAGAKMALGQGVKQAAKAGLKKPLAQVTAKEIAAIKAVNKAKKTGFLAGGLTASTAQSAGEIYQGIKEETGEASPAIAASLGVVAGSIDFIPIVRILKKLGVGDTVVKSGIKETLKKSGKWKDIAKMVGVGAAGGAATEGATEGVQEIINQAALEWANPKKDHFGPEGWSQIMNAAALGALGGGVMGGAAGPFEGKVASEIPGKSKEEVDAEIREARRTQRARVIPGTRWVVTPDGTLLTPEQAQESAAFRPLFERRQLTYSPEKEAIPLPPPEPEIEEIEITDVPQEEIEVKAPPEGIEVSEIYPEQVEAQPIEDVTQPPLYPVEEVEEITATPVYGEEDAEALTRKTARAVREALRKRETTEETAPETEKKAEGTDNLQEFTESHTKDLWDLFFNEADRKRTARAAGYNADRAGTVKWESLPENVRTRIVDNINSELEELDKQAKEIKENFAPTHELSDGTEVQASATPGLFFDKEGNEIEDEYATPLEEKKKEVAEIKEVVGEDVEVSKETRDVVRKVKEADQVKPVPTTAIKEAETPEEAVTPAPGQSVEDAIVEAIDAPRKISTNEASEKLLTLFQEGNLTPSQYRDLRNRIQRGETDGLAEIIEEVKKSGRDPSKAYMPTEKVKLETDLEQIIALTGQNAYKAGYSNVVIKEVLQNSFDAVKTNARENGVPGKIDIKVDTEERTITFVDNGIGMTPAEVKKHFLTYGGTGKGGIGSSGGMGVAKGAFLIGSAGFRLETVKDGIRTILEATPKEIMTGDADLHSEEAPGVSSGTTLLIKVPESYMSADGTPSSIHIPYNPDNIKFFDKPLIGPTEVTWSNEDRGPEVLPMGNNFDPEAHGVKLFSPIKFSWGTGEIYIGTKREKYPAHHVLSDGLYQFDMDIRDVTYEKLPFKLIINIHSSVTSKDPRYPFNNTREGFRPTIEADVKALEGYLWKIANGRLAEEVKDSFKDVRQLPRVETEGVPQKQTAEEKKKAQEAFKKYVEEIPKEVVTPPPPPPRQVEVGQGEVTEVRGRGRGTKREKVFDQKEEEANKRAERSFEAEKEVDLKKVFEQKKGKLNREKPIFHNNLDVDFLKEFGADALRFFSEIGTVVTEFIETLGDIDQLSFGEFQKNKKDALVFGGISLDKTYRGVFVRVPYSGLFVNPLSVGDAKSLPGFAESLYLTMVHEAAHHISMNHDERHTLAIHSIYEKLADRGLNIEFNEKLGNILYRHKDTFNQMRLRYESWETKNRGKPLDETRSDDEIIRLATGNREPTPFAAKAEAREFRPGSRGGVERTDSTGGRLVRDPEKFDPRTLAARAKNWTYSPIARALEKIQQKKGSPQQFLAMLKKSPGVKPEELEWTGVEDWLNSLEGTINKEEIETFIRENGIQVLETTIPDEDFRRMEEEFQVWRRDRDEARDRYDKLIDKLDAELPRDRLVEIHEMAQEGEPEGLTGREFEIYKELYDVMLAEETATDEMRYLSEKLNTQRRPHYPKYTLAGDSGKQQPPEYSELILSLPESMGNLYRSSHWDRIENPLAHVRLSAAKDSQGKRTLVLEEVQSDWHQEGRQHGYRIPLTQKEKEIEELKISYKRKLDEISARLHNVLENAPVRRRIYRPHRFSYYQGAAIESEARVRVTAQKFREDLEWLQQEYPLTYENHEIYQNNLARYRNEMQRYVSHRRDAINERIEASRDFNALSDEDKFEVEEIRKEQADYQNRLAALPPSRKIDRNTVRMSPFMTSWPLLAMKRTIRWAVENGFEKVVWPQGEVHANRYGLSTHFDKLMFKRIVEDEWVIYGQTKSRQGMEPLARGISPDQFKDYVGEELANRVINQNKDTVLLEGDDLVVGGEGMKGFYDQILPKIADKYIKKFGATVSKEYFPQYDKTLWSFPITRQLIDHAIQGMPLFSRKENPSAVIDGAINIDSGTVDEWRTHLEELVKSGDLREDHLTKILAKLESHKDQKPSYEGVEVSVPVLVESTGEQRTLKMDAAEEIRLFERRLSDLRKAVECFK